MTSHKRMEHVKTALIAILALSAVFLGWRTTLFNELFKSIPFFGSVAGLVKSSSGDETGGAPPKEAALPYCIVITGDENAADEGWRYGVKYDTDARNAVYNSTSSILMEALGAASYMSMISEDEWRAALSGPGVYYEYINPVKLSLLDFWLGASIAEQHEDAILRRIFVAFGTGKNKIYYQNSDNGLFFCADTASSAGVERYADIYSPNGTRFAYEIGIKGTELAPYSVILQESPRKSIQAATPGTAEDMLAMTLEHFRNSTETYTTSRYGNEGELLCIGAQFNITANPNGAVLYRLNENLQHIAGTYVSGEREMIEQARLIASDTVGAAQGDAEVFFDSAAYNGDGSFTMKFGYYIAGGRIHLYDDESAAKVTIRDGVVTEAEFIYRTYTVSDDYNGLLPEIQALAAAGGEFMLYYSDSGQELLLPFWLAMQRGV